ncbi:MAG: hypothetical protein RLZZ413_472, partial [Pseudomonadota bacterium]
TLRYGYSRDAFLQMSMAEIEAEDIPASVRNLRTAPGPAEQGPRRHRLQSGKIIDVDITEHRVDLNGSAVKLVVARDVSHIVEHERQARAAAEASARQFKAMFEAVPGKFLVMTVNPYRIVAVSDSFLQATGFSRDHLVGKLLVDALPDDPDDPAADGQANLLASLQRVEASGVADVMPLVRYSIGPRDGGPGRFEERFWSAVNTPMLGRDGGVDHIINRVEDVTDLIRDGNPARTSSARPAQVQNPSLRFGIELMIRAEELQVANSRLQEKTLNLRAAQRLMNLATWKLTPATGALVWLENPNDILGTQDMAFGGTLDDYLALIHPDDRAQVTTVFDRFVASRQPQTELSHRCIRPAGDVIHVKGMLESRDLGEGRVIFGVLRDVTAERVAEERLGQASQLARLAGRIAKLGSWRLEYDPNRVTWSDETAAIHAEPAGFMPDLEKGLDYYPAEDRARILAVVDACRAEGTPFDEVLQLVTAHGDLIWVRSIGEPEHDNSGRVIAVRGAFQDITELVAMRSKADALSQRLAQTLENLSEAFLTLDKDWRFSFVNHKAEQVLGLRRESLLGRSFGGFSADQPGVASGPNLLPELKQAFETQTALRVPQYFSQTLNIWLELNAYPDPEGLAIYFRDITHERAQTEQLALLEKSVSHLNDVLIITEAVSGECPVGPRILYVNDAFSRVTGFSKDEILGCADASHPESAAQHPALLRILESVGPDRPAVSEMVNSTRNGTEYWVDVSINPVTDGAGTVTHRVSVQRDITERKRAERAMRQSEERFRLISSLSSAVVWDVDLTNGTVWFNNNLSVLLGYPQVGSGPDLATWRKLIHPEDIGRYLVKLNAAVDGDALTWEDEFRIIRQDGTPATIADRAFLIRDEAGKAVRMLGSLNDVTAEKIHAARLRQSQKLEAMGQLTGGVAHDFNNLLTVIMGNAEMISETASDSKIRQMADITVSAAERGAALTSRLLAFARKQPLKPSPISMTTHVTAMGGMLRRTLSEDIQIDYLPRDGLWKVEVDPNQLEVALLNLVLNARDAMPDGGKLTIETANASLDEAGTADSDVEPGDYVQLSVTDTGTGMVPEVLERAFEPFFTTKSEGLGSGLGLSLVYGFVTQSGGHIRTCSEPGIGTCFTLFFPRSLSIDTADLPGRTEADATGGNEHILVVEDDDHVREHLVTQLKLLGYDVAFATNGQGAFDYLATGARVDLVLTDVIMPGGMNGRQLADAARKLRPGLRVLYTSGYSENAIVHHGRLDKGVELLSKPYRRQELAAKLRKVLDAPPLP